jgi:hypothetical protein
MYFSIQSIKQTAWSQVIDAHPIYKGYAKLEHEGKRYPVYSKLYDNEERLHANSQVSRGTPVRDALTALIHPQPRIPLLLGFVHGRPTPDFKRS